MNPLEDLSVVTLVAVLIMISIRQIFSWNLHIWQIMLAGAITVLVGNAITPRQALEAINWDVIVFLFGMFVLAEALYKSGYLMYLSYRFFRRASSVHSLLLMILLGGGLTSAIIMNDTLAIVGTPVVLHLARIHKIPPKVLLLALAFAVTTGSVLSPIGNPQNLLIALSDGMYNPFVIFFKYLFIPTILNIFLVYFVFKLAFTNGFKGSKLSHVPESIDDPNLAKLSKISLIILLLLIIIKIAFVALSVSFDFRLTYIAIAAALPILILSQRRSELVLGIDWSTLVFFASMFVLMSGVWQSGIFQDFLVSKDYNIASIPVILCFSVIVSQFVSNVPFVALYLPIINHLSLSPEAMMALAAGSTIAGNMTIMGAASNVIIIQNAEREGETIGFWDFSRIGIPVTILNVLVYWAFLAYPL